LQEARGPRNSLDRSSWDLPREGPRRGPGQVQEEVQEEEVQEEEVQEEDVQEEEAQEEVFGQRCLFFFIQTFKNGKRFKTMFKNTWHN